MEKEDYIFPENNWYLKIDDENRDIVNNWRINIIKFSKYPCNCIYVNSSGWWWPEVGGVEITTEQFKEYVLGITTQQLFINEDYSYLIDLFKKLGIK